MKKLKNLSQEDLDQISDFISSTTQNFILGQVSKKEISDIDIKVELSYSEELSVDISIELFLDQLSNQDPEIVNEALEFAHNSLDKFLDDHYRI
ncbi:DUF3194 domain-containing protein [Methanobacterium alcaliphilum]|uniref:DUF3194 domain-containing protein n=1 Tax=Methanobacterium alcaliphilum TaxID=392018 RepID=UPI00200AA8AE|nr:DUF3194 domain-containing protein [Methanobacterium alcaliphilum]MCK9152055.1 DUF3194 domain-containing protein [Methanobacterium alcaliphilum]